MPAISTLVYPAPAYVRVEVNWADVGAATGAAVYRVDCITGERVPLRPYVSFDGDFIDLSCGYAIFWDTEAPLDHCFYYCTQAANAAGNLVTQPAASAITDTFTRVVVNGFGSTDNGLAYTLAGGTVPGDYDVNGTRGTFALATVTTSRRAWVDSNMVNFNAYAEMWPTQVATGASISMGLTGRLDSVADTYYTGEVQFTTGGTMTARIRSTVASVFTTLATQATGITYTATSGAAVRFQAWGNQLKLKIWDITTPEPGAWTIEITDTAIATGGDNGFRMVAETGNTNAALVVAVDNWLVVDPCAALVPIEVCTSDLTVPSSSEFRLGDPMRPCNDVVLQFTPRADPGCVPTQGIFFARMDDEVATANSGTMEPVNSVFPIGIYRSRRSLASTLTTLTRTFADRDAMRQLNAPGGPLLLRGPAQYGIGDRYMLVGDVTEHRELSDHRVQPRAVVMPHVQLAYPYGPSQGVCGTRVEDLCDIYTTWDAMRAAGLTYADLLRGKASNDTPIPDTVERTWSDVNTGYANWTAVNSGNTDWDDLRDGA